MTTTLELRRDQISADLRGCVLATVPPESEFLGDCRGMLHTMGTATAAGPVVHQVEVCSTHRLALIRKYTKAGIPIREVFPTARCAYHQDIYGEDRSQEHGPCTGELMVAPVRRFGDGEPQPVFYDVLLCEAHHPAGGDADKAGRTLAGLPDDHPVTVWNALELASRGVNNDHLRKQIRAAERLAHGIAMDAPAVEISRAEGHDQRLKYRWALPYLRAYADLLCPGSVFGIYRQAYQFQVPLPENTRLGRVVGPVSTTGQEEICEVGKEPVQEDTGAWYVDMRPAGGEIVKACAAHAVQLLRGADDPDRAGIMRNVRNIATTIHRRPGDWATVLQQALHAQAAFPQATPGGITWQQIIDHAWQNHGYHHMSDDPHQRGWLRMPHDSSDMGPAGRYAPAWVCCGCGQPEPTEYMLQINHGCCGRYNGCTRDASNAHRREKGIEPYEPYVGCWVADLPADQAHTDCNCVAVITALAGGQTEPAPPAAEQVTVQHTRLSIGTQIEQACKTLGLPIEVSTPGGVITYVVDGQPMTPKAAADFLLDGGFTAAYGADAVRIHPDRMFDALSKPVEVGEQMTFDALFAWAAQHQ